MRETPIERDLYDSDGIKDEWTKNQGYAMSPLEVNLTRHGILGD